MTSQRGMRWLVLLTVLCVAWGVTRATSLKFEQQRDAFVKYAIAERGRLGLSTTQAKIKYPTPEITLCEATPVAPGATAQVVVGGKFVPGTKFLYENDSIEVVNESATQIQYKGLIRAAQDALPCVTSLHAFSPVSGTTAACRAVYVSGLPDWEFSAANGWVVRLVKCEAEVPPKGGGDPRGKCVAEFYRRGEVKPFESYPAELALSDACPRSRYTLRIRPESAATTGPSTSVIEEYQKIAQRLSDPKITPAEYEKLLARMTELANKMQAGSEAMLKQTQQQNEASLRFEKFGCSEIEFTAATAASATGTLECRDQATGQRKEVKLTGGAKPRKP